MNTAAQQTNTPADLLKYQNDLVRTGQALALGRMKMISIGPNNDCPPRDDWDPIMKKHGRLIQLRELMLPIAQAPDKNGILVTAPLLDKQGRVRLPDLGLPDWHPREYTHDEALGKAKRPAEADTCPMIPQSLHDRAESILNGTDFYVFSPVLSIAFQPEGLGTFWAIDCKPNPVDGTHPTLLIDGKTGETHFIYGLYQIVRAQGEN